MRVENNVHWLNAPDYWPLEVYDILLGGGVIPQLLHIHDFRKSVALTYIVIQAPFQFERELAQFMLSLDVCLNRCTLGDIRSLAGVR